MIERRKDIRLDLTELIARLRLLPEKREIDFSPINVSRGGISIFTTESLAPGQALLLEIDEVIFELRVKWCQSNPDNLATFRCGLELVDDTVALDKVVKKHLAEE